jgi:hypothetical protein
MYLNEGMRSAINTESTGREDAIKRKDEITLIGLPAISTCPFKFNAFLASSRRANCSGSGSESN